MNRKSNYVRYTKLVRSILIALALTLSLVFSTSSSFAYSTEPVQANQPQGEVTDPGTNPHTPVYSDPSVQVEAVASSRYSELAAPYEGTGEEAIQTFNRAEVAELLSLEAMSAPKGIETVLGTDTRVRTYTTSYPARAVALVTFTGGRCTGWFIGSNTVATAGHCVHDGGAGGNWHTNVRVRPGYNGNTAPYGTCTAKWLATVNGWVSSANEQYDYGVIKLNCTVGNRTGWFGFWWQTDTLNTLPTIISGYPGDKPLEQWWSVDQVRVTQARQIFYTNDTFGGMSGSPVWQDRPIGSTACANGPCAMAIHAYGPHGASPHSQYNHGTRINRAVFNNLVSWKNEP